VIGRATRALDIAATLAAPAVTIANRDCCPERRIRIVVAVPDAMAHIPAPGGLRIAIRIWMSRAGPVFCTFPKGTSST
jgi:hypothetical protein